MEKIILRYVLDNSVRFGGKANPKSVIGTILGEVPELRKEVKAVSEEVSRIVKEVNKMSLAQQKERLKSLGGGVVRKKKVETERSIPELEGDTTNIVMRFAPNPNGPIHLGHCRQALWNWFFVQRYNGRFILRFDDTDAKVKVPMKEAYDWFVEDLKWLGIKPNKIVKQSSRFDKYYSYAERLIEKGGAYVCDCDINNWRKLIKKKKGCKCRSLSVNEQMKRWKKMFKGYKEGEAVYRVKTDLTNPNPAIRDWAGFRIVNKPKHPFVKVKVWPLLNFASAIDDHEFKVTHILRGVDLKVSDERQKYLYNYFNWTYPITRYSGKFFVEGIKSTSQIKQRIKEGKYIGWDDPRLATIKALRRKGFCSEGLKKFIREVGINKSDVNVSIAKLEAFNKDYLDSISNRYFFIKDPVKIEVKGLDSFKLELDLHPDNQKGGRKFKVNKEFYIEESDLKDWKIGNVRRLMDCVNVERVKSGFRFHSKGYDKRLKIIHWLGLDVLKIRVMKEGRYVNGLVESGFKRCKLDDIIQFVRFGFVRVDKPQKEVWFAHK